MPKERPPLHAEATTRDPEVAEAAVIAEEMAACYRKRVLYFREEYRESPEGALKLADQFREAGYLQMTREDSPKNLSWGALGDLADADPKAALECWRRAKQLARDELCTGHRAAEAIEGYGFGPWDRARFLAIREEMRAGWDPQPGVESLLIDQLAQAFAHYLYWSEQASNGMGLESGRLTRPKPGSADTPRLTFKESTDCAYEYADKWNRVFLRTLRALRDLRRYAVNVTIQGAGQVNVGERQVNVAEVAG